MNLNKINDVLNSVKDGDVVLKLSKKVDDYKVTKLIGNDVPTDIIMSISEDSTNESFNDLSKLVDEDRNKIGKEVEDELSVMRDKINQTGITVNCIGCIVNDDFTVMKVDHGFKIAIIEW